MVRTSPLNKVIVVRVKMTAQLFGKRQGIQAKLCWNSYTDLCISLANSSVLWHFSQLRKSLFFWRYLKSYLQIDNGRLFRREMITGRNGHRRSFVGGDDVSTTWDVVWNVRTEVFQKWVRHAAEEVEVVSCENAKKLGGLEEVSDKLSVTSTSLFISHLLSFNLTAYTQKKQEVLQTWLSLRSIHRPMGAVRFSFERRVAQDELKKIRVK